VLYLAMFFVEAICGNRKSLARVRQRQSAFIGAHIEALAAARCSSATAKFIFAGRTKSLECVA